MPELADSFARSFGPRWAVTGSVALRLHAFRLGRADLVKKRPVTDADVVFRGDPRSQLPYALSAAGRSPIVSYSAQDANAPTSFNFAPGIRVDVMPEVADRWGPVKSAVNIEGIPVLPLKMLENSKRLAVREGRAQGAKSALERNKRNLRLIETLLSVEAPAAMTASSRVRC